jgi:hypothetical protein
VIGVDDQAVGDLDPRTADTVHALAARQER